MISQIENEIGSTVAQTVKSGQYPHYYLKQLNLLTIIRHLSLLFMETQKHRGTSMAVLEGDLEFEPQVMHEQAVIQRLIYVIAYINRQSGESVFVEKWQGIEKDWESLVQNWRNDTVIANFEFHNHIIDSMVKLIWDLAGEAGYFSSLLRSKAIPGSDAVKADLLYSEKNQVLLIQIALKLMPEMLENIAKLRGLATRASVRGYCDSEAHSRFSCLLQSLNLNKERLRVTSRSLQHEALRAVPSLPSILLHEHRLDKLQTLIQNKVMVNGEISLKGLEIFGYATNIIDVYSQIIRDAVSTFQQRIEYALLK